MDDSNCARVCESAIIVLEDPPVEFESRVSILLSFSLSLSFSTRKFSEESNTIRIFLSFSKTLSLSFHSLLFFKLL